MPLLQHGTAELEPGVRLHHVQAGNGPRTMVLLHGYPQTWWEWRHAIPPLVEAGWRIVAPDYRGAGHSSKLPGGYDTHTVAQGDKVLVHLRMKGRHTGDFNGISATGRRIDAEVMDLFRVEGGKLVEHWALMDNLTMLKQVGAVDA